MAKKEVRVDQLRRTCDPERLPFKTTDDVKPLKGTIGHKRAINAIDFGLASKMKGFNIFLLGDPGSGKTSILKKILAKRAKMEPTPPDWIYVYNFKDANSPQAYKLPTGMGKKFQKDIANLVVDLTRLIPKLQEGERYLKLGQEIEEKYLRREEGIFRKLKRMGKANGLIIEQVSGEMLIQAVRDGHPLDNEEFEMLSADVRKEYEEKAHSIQDDIGDFLRFQRKQEREKQQKIRELDREQILKATEDILDDLKKKYRGVAGIGEWLTELWAHIPEAFEEYQRGQEDREQIPEGPLMFQPADFHQFRVNLFVDNKDTKGAPVVYESAPTFHNMVGQVEYQEQYGILHTDFTLVRAGSLHRANGGYLIIQVNDLMKSMYAWDELKKALRNKEIRITELDIEQRVRSTVSPKPSPIPLQTKVILIGSMDSYYFLLNYDEDFSRLFKVKAEFDEALPLTMANIKKYAAFIRRLVDEDGLLPFHASAVAKIVEHGSRLTEHKRKISAQFINLINVVSEANFWAIEERKRLVRAEHIKKALQERNFRQGKLEYEMYEQIAEGSVLIDTKGSVIGQINGIAIYDMGDHAFGIPSRITAKTYVGRSGILNIDREVNLAGQIHNKASLILVGLIGNLYAQDKPLSMSSSICFEQMYGGIEGDSASCAELFALISSLSNIPINQGVCVTGSLNQNGEVQPIGGVNEKIEGVYRIFKSKGLTGNQGVVIPFQNIINLMLDEEVVDAVKKGRFNVWSIRNINDGLEAVMGRSARQIHKCVRNRLKEIREALE